MRPAKVIVAMSGGVDSSVAAALLVRDGHDVTGITLDIWPAGEESPAESGSCCGYRAAEDARRVCHALNIPHYVLNFRDLFERTVIKDFCDEYRRGRTPNPCIRCNELVKFDALRVRAKELGAAYLATGHYARILPLGPDGFGLCRARDRAKDQSYALYMLTADVLSGLLFPLGDMTKREVRREAKRLGLRVAGKPESQEICFIPSGSYAEFLHAQGQGTGGGEIVTTTGEVVGTHDGVEGYTVGQRKGIGAHGGRPKYVVSVDAARNRVTIGDDSDLYGRTLAASDVRWTGEAPRGALNVNAKVRYNTDEAPARIEPLGDERVRVVFEEPQRAMTPGQAVVFYDDDLVLGGATIDKVELD